MAPFSQSLQLLVHEVHAQVVEFGYYEISQVS